LPIVTVGWPLSAAGPRQRRTVPPFHAERTCA
jgi:hypothetical protein